MGRARHCRNPGVLWVKRVRSQNLKITRGQKLLGLDE